MRKTILIVLLVLVPVALVAQDNNFRIKGTKLRARQVANGTVVKLLDRQTWDSIGCGVVKHGKVVIEGHTDTTFMGWLTDSRKLYFPIVVEPNMSAKFNARWFTIEGTLLNEQLNRYTSVYQWYSWHYYDSQIIFEASNGEGFLAKLGTQGMKEGLEGMDYFNNHLGWQIYSDNADNVVGAWMMYHYLDGLKNDGAYGGDSVRQYLRAVDSMYAAAAPVVRNFAPCREAYGDILRQKNVSKGNLFTDFAAISMATRDTVRLSSLIKGHVAVVDFWASWCGPCRHEIKNYLKPLYEKYADRGLVIVGVGVHDKMAAFEKAIQSLEIPYPQIIDTTNAAASLYGVQGLPQVFVIGADGTMIGAYREKQLVTEVEKQLGIKPSGK